MCLRTWVNVDGSLIDWYPTSIDQRFPSVSNVNQYGSSLDLIQTCGHVSNVKNRDSSGILELSNIKYTKTNKLAKITHYEITAIDFESFIK